MQTLSEQPIAPPVDRALLLQELTPERKIRDTKKADNETIFSPQPNARR